MGMLRKRILTTGISSDAGLCIVRELVRRGYEVVGADWRRLPLGMRSRHLHRLYALPEPETPGFGLRLIELIRQVQPDAFLPLLETSVVEAASRHRNEIQSLTKILVPPDDAFGSAFNKARCKTECSQLGLACPDQYSPEEAACILRDGCRRTAIVVKPGTDVGMARSVVYARSPEELDRGISECKARYASVTLEEYIPGNASHMHTVVALFNRRSELAAAFTMQKLRQWPLSGGVTAMAVSTDEFRLVEDLLPFFRKTRWCGPVEVELKMDARDGRFKVIEINPRFPGYLRFPIECGLPLAHFSASLALDEEQSVPVPYPAYAVGKRYVNPGIFLRAALGALRNSDSPALEIRKIIADLPAFVSAVRTMMADPLPAAGRAFLDFR